MTGGGAKKALRPAQRRVVIDTWRAQFSVSARRACHVLQATRSTYQYRSRRDPQAFLRKKIRELAEMRTRYGYRRMYVLLRREGWMINHKRVYRLYRAEGLQVRQKPSKRRVAVKARGERSDATAPNVCWAMDFVHDQLLEGHRFTMPPVVETYSKICPAIGGGT